MSTETTTRASTARAAGRAVRRTLATVESWLLDAKHARIGLAVTRILLGLAAVGLLLTNFSTRLYSFGPGSLWNGEGLEPKSDFPQLWLFSWFHQAMGDATAYTALYLLLLVLALAFTAGLFTRWVHPVFWVLWVSFIEANDMLGDQGDNMFRIALLFMLFADCAGCWSVDAWLRRRRAAKAAAAQRAASAAAAGKVDAVETAARGPSSWEQIQNLGHNLVLVILFVQVSFVYVAGGLYKANGDPWKDGYAVYAPLQTERFGTWPELSDALTAWGPMVAAATWGSILMQIAFPFMLMRRVTRIIGLIAILTFHVAIGVLMGLPWFSLSMIAIDSIFVSDRTWQALGRRIRGLLNRRPRRQAAVTA